MKIAILAIRITAFIIAGMLIATNSSAQVVEEDPEQLRAIRVDERLNEYIPLDLTFTADDGRRIKLEEYFYQEKPVILILGYYTCPMLCNLVFNGVRDVVKEMAWTPGKEFQILTVSIDPRETDVVASAKKKNYIESIGKPGIDDGWIFLTGEEDQSRVLADALGFHYYYDEKEDQYAHPAVIFILTEEGKISRYFYGIQFRERDVRLAMMDAADGRVGSTLDKIILYCYHYDPDAGSYVIFAGNIMRIGGILTVIVLGFILAFFWIRERRKKART